MESKKAVKESNPRVTQIYIEQRTGPVDDFPTFTKTTWPCQLHRLFGIKESARELSHFRKTGGLGV